MKRSLLLRGRDDKDQDEEEMDNIIRRRSSFEPPSPSQAGLLEE